MLLLFFFIQKSLASEVDSSHSVTWEEYSMLLMITFCLILFAGAMSGLTVGLMSFSIQELENKIICGSDQEVKHAKRILPIVSKHHLLLVTLLFGNTIAMETLPIMLEMMVGGGGAILISVPLLMIFGEVLPQALCTGPNRLSIASNLVPVVKVVTFILYPVSYPISIFLDNLLGEGDVSRHVKDISELDIVSSVKHKENKAYTSTEDDIEDIDIEMQSIEMYLKPISNVYRLNISTLLTNNTLKTISEQKHSKIPVYHHENDKLIAGILLTRELVGIDEDISLKDSGIKLEEPLFVVLSSTILSILSAMYKHKTQIAIVVDSIVKSEESKAIGIITLDDIMDIIHNHRLVDDTIYDRKYTLKSISNLKSDISEGSSRTLMKNLELSSKSYLNQNEYNPKIKI